MAKVIFLHLSVIHSDHKGGVLIPGDVLIPGGVLSPRGVLSPGGCVSGPGGCLAWGVSGMGGITPPNFCLIFFFDFLFPPPPKQTQAYGQRAASTHPTGMHSC